jgi:hypothetical protein
MATPCHTPMLKSVICQLEFRYFKASPTHCPSLANSSTGRRSTLNQSTGQEITGRLQAFSRLQIFVWKFCKIVFIIRIPVFMVSIRAIFHGIARGSSKVLHQLAIPYHSMRRPTLTGLTASKVAATHRTNLVI